MGKCTYHEGARTERRSSARAAGAPTVCQLCDPTVPVFMLLYLAVSPASGFKNMHCIIYKVFNIRFNIILALPIIIVISVYVV